MDVSFAGGKGPRAVATVVGLTLSDTELVDTIKADVTVPKKAKSGSVWDVHVGSRVLVDGFQVVP